MIEAYFVGIEQILNAVPNIQNLTLRKTLYNNKQGYIAGSVLFEGGDRLDFTEVKDTSLIGKTKYRYQYMDTGQNMIFRYDNAPHHRQTSTFPHHKHDGEMILDSIEPSLADVLLEIAEYQRINGL